MVFTATLRTFTVIKNARPKEIFPISPQFLRDSALSRLFPRSRHTGPHGINDNVVIPTEKQRGFKQRRLNEAEDDVGRTDRLQHQQGQLREQRRFGTVYARGTAPVTRQRWVSKSIKTADFKREGQCGAEGLGSAGWSGGNQSPAAAGRQG